jgi:hypothetical protein
VVGPIATAGERVRAALAAWHRAHASGEPSAANYRARGHRQHEPVPSASSIKRRFDDSWDAVRAAAGLPASRGERARQRKTTATGGPQAARGDDVWCSASVWVVDRWQQHEDEH